MPAPIVQCPFRLVVVVGVVLAAASAVAGTETTQEERPFQNLQILDGAPPEQVALIMQAMSLSLGVECVHCHRPGAFELDTEPAKEIARSMMRMVAALGSTTFEVLEVPSCWTCHRGSVTPVVVPPLLEFPVEQPFGPFLSSTDPAGDVYENVITHASLPAIELREVMASYTRALGVGCDHCHVPGEWASDEIIGKQLTRIMAEMQRNLDRDVFDGEERISCWTCHRGEVTPQSNMPPRLIPELAIQ